MKQKNEDIMVSCNRCANSISIGHTTYDMNGRDLICFNCYNKIAQGKTPDRLIQSAEMPDRINYKCLSCHFTFSRAATFQFNGRCFNCGKQSVQKEDTQQLVMRDRKSLLDY